MWGYIIAVISGMLMSVQGIFNTGVTQKAGVWVTAVFVQLSAMIVCIAAWFISGRSGSFSELLHFDKKYMLLGGVIGAFITYTVIVATESLHPAKAAIFIVASQLILSYLIELLGIFGVDKAVFQWRKLFGLLIMIVGIAVFKYEK